MPAAGRQEARFLMGVVISAAVCLPSSAVGDLRQQSFVVETTADATRMSRAASRAGSVVHALWIGDVKIEDAIKVGKSTRLTIVGRRAAGGTGTRSSVAPRISGQLRRGGEDGETEEAPPLAVSSGSPARVVPRGRGSYRDTYGLFDIHSNASLVLENLFLSNSNPHYHNDKPEERSNGVTSTGIDDHFREEGGDLEEQRNGSDNMAVESGAGRGCLYLHPDSHVTAHNCWFDNCQGGIAAEPGSRGDSEGAGGRRQARGATAYISAGARLTLGTGCSVLYSSNVDHVDIFSSVSIDEGDYDHDGGRHGHIIGSGSSSSSSSGSTSSNSAIFVDREGMFVAEGAIFHHVTEMAGTGEEDGVMGAEVSPTPGGIKAVRRTGREGTSSDGDKREAISRRRGRMRATTEGAGYFRSDDGVGAQDMREVGPSLVHLVSGTAAIADCKFVHVSRKGMSSAKSSTHDLITAQLMRVAKNEASAAKQHVDHWNKYPFMVLERGSRVTSINTAFNEDFGSFTPLLSLQEGKVVVSQDSVLTTRPDARGDGGSSRDPASLRDAGLADRRRDNRKPKRRDNFSKTGETRSDHGGSIARAGGNERSRELRMADAERRSNIGFDDRHGSSGIIDLTKPIVAGVAGSVVASDDVVLAESVPDLAKEKLDAQSVMESAPKSDEDVSDIQNGSEPVMRSAGLGISNAIETGSMVGNHARSRQVGAGGRGGVLDAVAFPRKDRGHFPIVADFETCGEGYEGPDCTACAQGYIPTPYGNCEGCTTRRKAWGAFRAALMGMTAVLVVVLSLDAVHNGKSPPLRIAQIWRIISCCGRHSAIGETVAQWHAPGIGGAARMNVCPKSSTVESGFTWYAGVRAKCTEDGIWGRDLLYRLVQGCMIFIATAQIISQGSIVLQLEVPAGLEWTYTWLAWTTLDPVSATGSRCLFTHVSFFDQVNGTIAFVTTYLALLLASYLSIQWSCRRCKHHRRSYFEHEHTQASSATGVQGSVYPVPFSISESFTTDDCAAAGRGRGMQGDPRGSGGQGVLTPQAGTLSLEQRWYLQRQSLSGMEAGMGGAGGGGEGVWERWDRWESWERHACALVVVCLLIHPVVCTTLLQVFDCSGGDGDGDALLRYDTHVVCLCAFHRSYQIASGIFLALYGVGLPAVVVAMVHWATEKTPKPRAFKGRNNRGQAGCVTGQETLADGAGGNSREHALMVRVSSTAQQSQQRRPPACGTQQDGECAAGLPMGRGSGADAWANSRRQYAFNKPILSFIRDDSLDIDLSGSCDSRSTPKISQRQQQQTQEHRRNSGSVCTLSTSDTSSRLEIRGSEGRGGARVHDVKDGNNFGNSRDSVFGREERQSPSSLPTTQQVAPSSGSGRPDDWAVISLASVGLSGSSSSSSSGGGGGVGRSSFSSDGEGVSGASDVELHVYRNGQDRTGRNGNVNSIRNGESVPYDSATVTAAGNRHDGCHGSPADGVSAAVGHNRLLPVDEEIAARRPSDAAANNLSSSRWRDNCNSATTEVEGTMQRHSHARNVSGSSSQNDACGAGIGSRDPYHKGGGWGGDRDVSAADPAAQTGAICRRCINRVWQGSGRGALWVGRKIACDAKPMQTDLQHSRRGEQWRATIPLWCPYRPSRYWFGAWELARRFLLTGMLTFVPAGDEDALQYERAATALVVAGLALLVGEVARPFRDPWISWLYRTGGVLITVVNLLGFLQKIGCVKDVGRTLATFLVVGVVLMGMCVCGGWRFSCAERYIAHSDPAVDRNTSLTGGKSRSNTLASHSGSPSVGAGLAQPQPVSEHNLCQSWKTDGTSRERRRALSASRLDVKQRVSSDPPAARMARAADDGSGGDKTSGDERTASDANPHGEEDVKGDDCGAFEGGWTEKQRAEAGIAFGSGAGSWRNSARLGGRHRSHRSAGKSNKASSWPLSSPSSYLDAVGAATPRGKDGKPEAMAGGPHGHFVNPMFSRRSPREAPAIDMVGDDGTAKKKILTRASSCVEGGRKPTIVADDDDASRRASQFGRFMLSRSPEAHSRIGGKAWGFNSVDGTIASGGGGSSMQTRTKSANEKGLDSASIDAHQKALGGLQLFNSVGGHAEGGRSVANVTPAASTCHTSAGIRPAPCHSRTSSGTATSNSHSRSGSRDNEPVTAAAAAGGGVRGLGFRRGKSASTTTSDRSPFARSRLLDRVLATKQPRMGRQWPFGAGSSNRAERVWGTRKSDSWSFLTTNFSSADGSSGAGPGSGTCNGGEEERSGKKHMNMKRRVMRSAGSSPGGTSDGARTSSGISGGILSRSSSVGRNSSEGLSRTSSLGRIFSSTGGTSTVSVGKSSVSSAGPLPPMLLGLGYEQWATSRVQVTGTDGKTRDRNQHECAQLKRASSDLGVSSNFRTSQYDGADQNDPGAEEARSVAQGFWSLGRSAMPAWWLRYSASGGGDAGPNSLFGDEEIPADLAAERAERAVAAELEAEAERVEAVFGEGGIIERRPSSISAGAGSNVFEFIRFVRAGGSGTSSFDSRASSGGDRSYGEEGEDGEDTAASRLATLDSHRQQWVGDKNAFRIETPLSSAELKRQFDFDFEDDGEEEEDPVSFLRISDRFQTKGSKGRGDADGKEGDDGDEEEMVGAGGDDARRQQHPVELTAQNKKPKQ